MKYKRNGIFAFILSIIVIHSAAGFQSEEIKPLPTEAFEQIRLSPTSSFVPISTPTPTPIPTPVATAPPKVQPQVKAKVEIVKSKPKLQKVSLSGKIARGVASYYCNSDASRGRTSRCTRGYPDGYRSYYAAIRKDLLFLRGRSILVCSGKCLPVKIIDCNCGRDANLIDLYGDAFAYFYPLTKGRFTVTIKW